MQTFGVASRDRLVFLHVPKTAGTSMRRYLASQYRPIEILPVSTWDEVVAQQLDVQRFRLFAGHFRPNVRPLLPQGTRSLVVLRDPVSRYLSQLRHAHMSLAFDRRQRDVAALTLADIIRHPVYSLYWANAQTHWMAVDPDSDPARAGPTSSNRAALTNGAGLARAKDNLAATDFIGFTEDLDGLAQDLCGPMHFHPPADFPVRNVGQNTAIGRDLRPEDVAIIERLNEVDRELYQYARALRLIGRRRASVVAMARAGTYVTPDLPFRLDLAAPMPGTGWHEPETDGALRWRWTDAATQTRVEFAHPFPVGTVCTIDLFDWALEGAPMLDVRVDGRSVALDLTRQGGGWRIAFTLADACEGAWCDITISTLHPAIEPADEADQRKLGVAVSSIVFGSEPPGGER